METQIPYVVPLSANPAKTITLVPSDPGSRYKTRQLQVQVVGKSKMIKTVLVNILDCAKYMQVPPSYLGTFMGYEIGAQAKFDPKKPERQQAFLSGEHDTKDLSRICSQFIQEVVLCPNCGLPEILIYIEDNKVLGNCRACGAHSPLAITNEKFKRYVVNHPPASSTKNSKGAFSGNKAGTKKDTSKGKKKDDGEENGEEDAEQEEQSLAKQFKEVDKSSKKEEVVWYSDASAEAARRRREELLPDTEIFQGTVVKPKLEDVKRILEGATAAEDLLKAKKSSGLTDTELINLVFEALVNPDSDVVAVAKSKQPLLSKIATSPAAQFALLDNVEAFCMKNKKLLTKVPVIVKELYDLDLLEEENILAWHKKETPAVTNIREQLVPLVKWLKEAEEESDDDEEEEDEE